MCSLIVLRGLSERHRLFVAANRDERTDRSSAPPGAWHGQRRKMLSPRDRVAGGTWLAVDDGRRFAGITNVHGEPAIEGAPSRGHLPHLALDHEDLRGGAEAVLERVAAAPHAAFQLVLADADQILVIRHVAASTTCEARPEPMVALSNEHAVGVWQRRRAARRAGALPQGPRRRRRARGLQARRGLRDGVELVDRRGCVRR